MELDIELCSIGRRGILKQLIKVLVMLSRGKAESSNISRCCNPRWLAREVCFSAVCRGFYILAYASSATVFKIP